MFDIIINPAGASGKTKKKWRKEIEPLFKEANVKYQVYYSSLEYDISNIIYDLTSTNEERNIVIIGGDGSLNLAVNGIQNFKQTRIGLIPCGSGNDFALGLGISKNIQQSIKQILKCEVKRKIDVGEVIYFDRYEELYTEEKQSDGYVHRRFMISSGIGFDAHICQRAQISSMKKALNKIHLGKLVYLLIAIQIIFSTKRIPTKITIDQNINNYSELLFAVGMNTKYEGGGFQFCPHASEKDHQLDLCVGNQLSQFDFFRIFPYAYSGSHLKFEGVYENRASMIEIESEQPMWVHTDGEVACKSKHIKMQILKESLLMLN